MLGDFDDDPNYIRGSRSYDNRPTGIRLADINLGNMTVLASTGNQAGARPPAMAFAANQPQPPARNPVSPPQDDGRSSLLVEKQVKLLREFDRKIKDKKGDTKALFDKYREQLKDIQPRLIRAVVEPKNVGTILAGSAQARTTHVTPAQAPPTPLGEACRKLAEQSTGTKDLVVRYSPTSAPEEKRVERITSLSVPAIEGSPEKDALSRFEGDIKPLLGKGVEVVPRPRDEAGGPQRFQQVYPDQSGLPVLGREVALYYDKQNLLTAVTNSTLRPR